MNNGFIKLIFSLPVIGVVIYFSPVVGVIMLLIKYFGVNGSNRYTTASLCSSLGLFLLIPKAIDLLSDKLGFSIENIDLLVKIIDSPVYAKIVIIGLIFFIFGILSLTFSKIRMKSYRAKMSGVRVADAEHRKED